MNSRTFRLLLTAAVILAPLLSQAAQPVGTAFGYQAYVQFEGTALDGTADFQFTLWDGPGDLDTQIGSPVNVNTQSVANGLLSVELDFGLPAFEAGEARWLEIEVRTPPGSGAYEKLAPRRSLLPTPFALQASTGGDPSPWTLSGSTVFYDAGRVGIGGSGSTDGAGEALTVHGPTQTWGGITMNVNGAGFEKPYYGYAVNGTQFVYTYYDSDEREWRIRDRSDQTSVSIDRFQNVGIARENPASALHIGGDVRVDALAGTGTRPVMVTPGGVLTAPSVAGATNTVTTAAAKNTDAKVVVANATGAANVVGVIAPINDTKGTSYFSIPAAAFTSDIAGQNITRVGGILAHIDTGSGAMSAAVSLPHGAIVSRIDVYYADASNAAMTLLLERSTFAGGPAVEMARVVTAGNAADPTRIRTGSDTSIAKETIDNRDHAYRLRAVADRWDGANLGVRGVRITYLAP